MPLVSISVSPEVADTLNRQARALLLSRHAYIRSLLTAAATTSDSATHGGSEQRSDRPTHMRGITRRHGAACCCWHYTASLPRGAVDALDRQAAELFLSRDLYVDGLLTAIARAGDSASVHHPALRHREQTGEPLSAA